MELIAVNLSAAPRRATLAGRSYLVAPVTLIVPGVLNGSQGPLYYPPEETQKNVQAWNGMPLVLRHPKTSDGYVSARTPEVLDGQSLGVLLNVRYADKLGGEAWFDEDRLKSADSSLYARVAAGQPVEMSTGLWTDNENTPGTYNGVSYVAVARNYRPDHLAVLPDGKGACSVQDGCGINVNAASTLLVGTTGSTRKHQHLVRVDRDGYGWTDWAEEHSHSVSAFAVLPQRYPEGAADGHTHMLKRESLIDSGVTTNTVKTELRKEENAMDEKQKKALVDYLIANCSTCDEKDRPALNELSDAHLTAWHDGLKGTVANLEAVTNEAHEPFKVGEQEFIWNAEKKEWRAKESKKADEKETVTANQNAKPALTKEQEDDLSFARQVRQERRDEAIAAIKANETSKLTDEQLKAMSLDVLQSVANSFPEKEQSHDPTYVGGSGKPTANARERYPYMPLPGETVAPVETAKA